MRRFQAYLLALSGCLLVFFQADPGLADICDEIESQEKKISDLEATLEILSDFKDDLQEELVRASDEVNQLRGSAADTSTLTKIEANLTDKKNKIAGIESDIRSKNFKLVDINIRQIEREKLAELESLMDSDKNPKLKKLREKLKQAEIEYKEYARGQPRGLFWNQDGQTSRVSAATRVKKPHIDCNDWHGTIVYDYCYALVRKDKESFGSGNLRPPQNNFSGKTKQVLLKKTKKLITGLGKRAKAFQTAENALQLEEKKILSTQEDLSIWSRRDVLIESKTKDEKDSKKLRLEIKTLQQQLVQLRNERDALEQSLQAEQRKKTPLQIAEERVNQTEADIQGADVDYTAKDQELTDARGVLREQENKRARFMQALRQLYNDGLQNGKVAIRFRDAGNREECLNHRIKSITILDDARRMADDNRKCLTNQRGLINKYLGRADQILCPDEMRSVEVVVPQIHKGMSKNKARALLIGAGFPPKNIFFSEYKKPEQPQEAGKVFKVKPAPGTTVEVTETITVLHYNDTWVEPDQPVIEDSVPVGTGSTGPAVPTTTTPNTSDAGAVGDWDAAADRATAKVDTHTQVSPDAPLGSPSLPAGSPAYPSGGGSSQVDRANEVAQQATAKGSQTTSVFNPQQFVDVLTRAAGEVSGTGGGKIPSTALKPGNNLKPASSYGPALSLPPTAGTTKISARGSGVKSSIPTSGSRDKSSKRCQVYNQQLQVLGRSNQSLSSQLISIYGDDDRSRARRKELACKVVNNSKQMFSTVKAANANGCDARSQINKTHLEQMKRLCR